MTMSLATPTRSEDAPVTAGVQPPATYGAIQLAVWRTRRQLGRWARRLISDEEGLSTIEYAMGTLAAAALAAVLYVIINSSAVSDAIEGIIMDALSNTPG